MEKKAIHLEIRRVEKELHRIGAKIADATELLQGAVEAKVLLLAVQRELEELYLTIGEEPEIK